MPNAELLEKDRRTRERLSTGDFDRNFLVSAGAGAGKTYLTVERAFNMLCDEKLGITPQQIVMITFTRKAATEMRIRLNRWIRDAIDKETDGKRLIFLRGLLNSIPEMQISTIHSFCRKVLSEYPLQSGIGFAPQFDSEEGGPDSRAEQFFDNAWRTGKFQECVNIGFPEKIALSAFRKINGNAGIKPQYADSSTPEGKEFYNGVLSECRDLLRMISESIGDTDPGLFNYRIENALRRGEDVADDFVLAAAKTIVSKGGGARGWIGKNARKTPAGACGNLKSLLSENADEAAALNVLAEAFAAAAGKKGEDREMTIRSYAPGLPDGFRTVAEVADLLPDDDKLAELNANIDILLHGIATREAVQASREYAAYRLKNHIVSLNDMLILTAALVKNHPDVREKLHLKYRTFFVDEYQDTDPVQTDIIFAITADSYDTDWHKCVPRQGSLFLVGDAKQGIYRFRGADISLWQEAEDVMRKTGGEVVYLYKNFRSTPEICQAVTDIFGKDGPLGMEKSPYQAEYSEMVANRESGCEAVIHHLVTCESEDAGYEQAALQIAQMIRDRVNTGRNEYKDFLLLSFFRERHLAYAEAFRTMGIPVKFDGSLPSDAYPALQLLNLRVQAVCHPFDESLSFLVLTECGGVLPEVWDLFRMEVKQLPEETRLARYRNIRSLMGHTEELREYLPDTEMNRNTLKALSMLNRDRLLSQERTPCAFLEEVVENTEGLFTDEYIQEEFQNQYAALLQVIDSIRGRNPQHFHEMAELLKASAEAEMDRMPSVRADDNFVRLMNLHKAKGLQGKVVIFLPGKVSTPSADTNLKREGEDTLGWFVLKEDGNYKSASYHPPGWKERSDEEAEFLKAERIRLKYVALTRAEDEAHVFSLIICPEGKKTQEIRAWQGFEAAGSQGETMTIPEENRTESISNDPETANAENRMLGEDRKVILESSSRRMSPSMLDAAGSVDVGINDPCQESDERTAFFTRPIGPDWGTAVHETAELIVREGAFSTESIETAVAKVTARRFPSEFLTELQRKALLIPKNAMTLEQIRDYIRKEICKALAFMADPDSSFRIALRGGICYPELPFTVSLSSKDGCCYTRLKELSGNSDEKRLEISGKMDLAVRYADGTWRLMDYKTDRMMPEDHGSSEAFHKRLSSEYGTQLEIYRVILEYLTGETVKDACIIPIG